MFMPLLFLSVWPAVFVCESGICAQTHYWLNLGTWSQSNLLSIWQGQEDIWKWKRWYVPGRSRNEFLCKAMQSQKLRVTGKQAEHWKKTSNWVINFASTGSQVQPTVWWQQYKAVYGCSWLGQLHSLPGNKVSGWLGPKCGVIKGATHRRRSVTTGVPLAKSWGQFSLISL